MNKFHTTVSRRTFMKGLGLAGAGLGAAAATAPVFHDLDEVIAAPQSNFKRPWYTKTGLDNPTSGVDWSATKRYDYPFGPSGQTYYPGYDADERQRRSDLKAETEKQWRLEGRPGYTLRDYALSGSAAKGAVQNTWLGPQKAKTPESLNLTKWTGTPEEASRMVRTAMRLFGSLTIGYTDLDPATTRKLIYNQDSTRGRRIVFKDDIDQSYVTDTEQVIPGSVRWVIVQTNQESQELWKRNPTQLMTQVRYGRAFNIQERLQYFLNGLGYQCLGEGHNYLGIAPAFGVMAGLGELGRINRLVTTEYGPTLGVFRWATDLPLAPTGQIDSGIFRFCKTCKKCAESCGEGTLSFETEPYWDIPEGQLFHNPGHEAWFEDKRKCGAWRSLPGVCRSGRCLSCCTFAKYNEASIHTIVSATLATTSVFNGFLKTMDDLFGYGLRGRRHDDFDIGQDDAKDAAINSWWDLDLPVYGIDSMIGAQRVS